MTSFPSSVATFRGFAPASAIYFLFPNETLFPGRYPLYLLSFPVYGFPLYLVPCTLYLVTKFASQTMTPIVFSFITLSASRIVGPPSPFPCFRVIENFDYVDQLWKLGTKITFGSYLSVFMILSSI